VWLTSVGGEFQQHGVEVENILIKEAQGAAYVVILREQCRVLLECGQHQSTLGQDRDNLVKGRREEVGCLEEELEGALR
jgi:hypothetical protein